MPKLSPTMEGGTLVKWHKKEGDAFKVDDLLFEVATDKATVEYYSLDEGFLRKILIHENEDALVNQAVAIFTEEKDESIEGYEPEGLAMVPVEESASPPIEETHVASTDQPTPVVNPGEGALVQPAFEVAPPLEDYGVEFQTSKEARRAASPLAKKLAREKGLDLLNLRGSGPGGRIMSRDLDLAQKNGIATFGSHGLPTEMPGSYEEEMLSPMRKAVGQKLQAAKTFIPHFYVQLDVDVDSLVSSREQLKKMGVEVTVNDYVMRATALALKEHSIINSGFDASKNRIIRFKTIDIAFAVSLNDGLITPIVRHVDYKNLGQISVHVKHLAMLAREKKLKPDQYRGGSFTISNLGMFGIDHFQAVINPPQVSILAVGGIRECAVVKRGGVVAGKRMTVSLSSDHRVVDGADAARFLKTLQKHLENPASLLI